MMIDIYYLWAENWVEHYHRGETCFGYILLIVSAGAYGLFIYFNVKLYDNFGGWGIGTSALTVNLVLFGIATILTIL